MTDDAMMDRRAQAIADITQWWMQPLTTEMVDEALGWACVRKQDFDGEIIDWHVVGCVRLTERKRDLRELASRDGARHMVAHVYGIDRKSLKLKAYLGGWFESMWRNDMIIDRLVDVIGE